MHNAYGERAHGQKNLHGENVKFDLRWMDSLQTVRHVQQAGRDKFTDKKNAKITEKRVAQNIAD